MGQTSKLKVMYCDHGIGLCGPKGLSDEELMMMSMQAYVLLSLHRLQGLSVSAAGEISFSRVILRALVKQGMY